MDTNHNTLLGRQGEDIAEKIMLKKGYEIIYRNYRTRVGEVDLIAKKEATLVFLEVKTRYNIDYGFGWEAVDSQKIDKIEKVAEKFLQNFDDEYDTIRIDIMEIYVENKKYRHLQGVT